MFHDVGMRRVCDGFVIRIIQQPAVCSFYRLLPWQPHHCSVLIRQMVNCCVLFFSTGSLLRELEGRLHVNEMCKNIWWIGPGRMLFEVWINFGMVNEISGRNIQLCMWCIVNSVHCVLTRRCSGAVANVYWRVRQMNLSLTPYLPCPLMHRQLHQYYRLFATPKRYHRIPLCVVKTNVKSNGVAVVNGWGIRGEREPSSPLSMTKKWNIAFN